MNLSRRQKREQERLVSKKKNKMVCMWCAAPGNSLEQKGGDKFFCPSCNDDTRIVYKHHFNKLNEPYAEANKFIFDSEESLQTCHLSIAHKSSQSNNKS